MQQVKPVVIQGLQPGGQLQQQLMLIIIQAIRMGLGPKMMEDFKAQARDLEQILDGEW